MSDKYQCCNRPDYTTAYAPKKPFKAKYCYRCNEVTLDCHPFWEFVWRWIYYPFWDGTVFVCKKKSRGEEHDS